MSQTDSPMTKKELRNFGLVTAGMLVFFFAIFIPWVWDFEPPTWPAVIALALVLLALIAPAALNPVYVVWMKFAHALGWVNTRIILSLIFFVIFLPAGLMLRAFSDPMRRQLDESIDSYRVLSTPPKIENLERPF